ncbi:MAG: dockerin type I domain-containing protein, partial [Porcipelethomonas sp.]
TDTTEPTTTPVQPTNPSTIEIGTPSLMGDVDLNGSASVSDVVRLAKFISSSTLYPLANSTAAANADVNHDKTINELDNAILIEYMLGRITSL